MYHPELLAQWHKRLDRRLKNTPPEVMATLSKAYSKRAVKTDIALESMHCLRTSDSDNCLESALWSSIHHGIQQFPKQRKQLRSRHPFKSGGTASLPSICAASLRAIALNWQQAAAARA